jgi:hypothetical protein
MLQRPAEFAALWSWSDIGQWWHREPSTASSLCAAAPSHKVTAQVHCTNSRHTSTADTSAASEVADRGAQRPRMNVMPTEDELREFLSPCCANWMGRRTTQSRGADWRGGGRFAHDDATRESDRDGSRIRVRRWLQSSQHHLRRHHPHLHERVLI